MINLVPTEGKKAVKREYLLRVASVWFLLFAIASAAVAVLLVPTYVLVVRQLEAETMRTAEAASTFDRAAYDAARAELKRANELAKQLSAQQLVGAPSETLDTIERVRSGEISITGFSYEHDGKTVKKLEVRGIAATREALASFTAAVEAEPLFERATVPVASLTRDRDLPFTMTIAPAKTSAP